MSMTADSITNAQIEALRQDAAEHGDHEQVEVCRFARYADGECQRKARQQCADVYNAAEAMRD